MNRINLIIMICVGLATISCSTPIAKIQESNLKFDEPTILPEALVEISGLQYADGKYFGFNDSGGKEELYFFDEINANNLQSIQLNNTKNVDWEDMALSDSLIFVGDFGNNVGNRDDLKIYYFPRHLIDFNLPNQQINPEEISFFYPEQKNLEKQAYQHDFDLESMVYFNQKLHLFTKEWKSEKTHHFSLDLVKGTQPAWLIEDFDIEFLVTSADVISIANSQSRLALVGYNRHGEVFLMLTDFFDASEKWLNQPKTILKIGEADELGQVEGVAFKNKNEVCISAEAIHSDLGNQKQNIRCIRF